MLRPTDQVIDGVRCAVHDSDPGKREAVVFVHGNPGPMDDWEGLIPAVEPFARVVAMDMPGYGRAERSAGFDYSIEGYGRYLGALLDRLGVEKAHLVLHDFGGPWGLRWAFDHPDAVASLTLVNAGIFEGYKWHGFARLWQMPVIGELVQLTSTKWGTKRTLNRMSPRPMPDAFFDRVWRYSDWGHKRAVLKLYRASKDLGRHLIGVGHAPFAKTLPTCVIWGAGDPFIGPEYAEKQKKFFPLAEVHVLQGLGHWPFVDDVEAVKGPLVEFLKGQVGRPG